MMLPLDLFFRSGNTAMLILLAFILFRESRHRPSLVLGSVLSLCLACTYLFSITLEWGWTALEIPLNLLTLASPFVFWLLAKSLFEDDFQWRWSFLWVYLAYMAAAVAGHYLTFGDSRGVAHWILRSDVNDNGLWLIPFIALHTMLVVLALYAALKDWRSDLVESRRRARVFSVVVSGIVILLINAKEFYQLGTARSNISDVVTTGMFFVLIIGVCMRFLRTRGARGPSPEIFPSVEPEDIDATGGEAGALIIDELGRLMEEEKVFREEGFTIRSLADKLGVKEYRLRRLINGHLGYRNFNRFLNEHRVREVARLLVEPESRHLPVLTIALDMGYRSLSPFNKAFKEIKGMTPTEYRSLHLHPGPETP
ncbi:MAG: helix-turn-helix domain-containing protein [Lysobacterales bacterium]